MRALAHAIGLALLVLTAVDARAQQADSTRVGPTRAAPPTVAPATRPEREAPPISPRRAFLTSLVLPGAGQAALDRPYAGGVFLLLEAATLALVHRAAEDLRLARAFRADSMPLRYEVNPTTGLVQRDADGHPVVAAWATSRFGAEYVRARRLHVEDWMAVLVFNHLFAGADAFVAAQLWDLPQRVEVRQTPFGPAIAATLSWGRRRVR